ncbi:hypothetical protein DICVIV_13573 [Dictyocaulus viviparus]|uniref:7TM GPCR serpentine receptor class x (Srx) domain-containing protein n=1 Tax=Dictyocaulus viviparus TaxID=29172 RepID=A0A0D8XA09_DICVI|nr:hypothetical protein DICVIV_13573 [Dictyocaulus viviparus]
MKGFMAITFPVRYRMVFTTKTTYNIMVFISMICAFNSALYFKRGCDFYFDHTIRIWTFGREPCSVWLAFYIDMVYNTGLLIIIGILDIFTLIHLKNRKKVSRRLFETLFDSYLK